jgi:hypothetical protein
MKNAQWMQSSVDIVRGAVTHMRTGTPSISGATPLVHARRSGDETSLPKAASPTR